MTVSISRHAQQRRKQMGVTEDRIRAAVASPDVCYPGPPDHPPGRTLYVRERIVVVVCDRLGEVVTVLWRGAEGR